MVAEIKGAHYGSAGAVTVSALHSLFGREVATRNPLLQRVIVLYA